MKRNDTLTMIGLFVGIGMMFYGMMGSNGFDDLKLFWDAPSVAITLGGSIASVMIVTPMSEFKKVGTLFIQSLKEPKISKGETILQFSELSKKARREGLLSLEDAINNLDDEFLKKGLQMVVDGIEPESIREILELDISEMEARHKSGSDIFKTWGGFAPAYGMLGTLIGLIQMLANLQDSSTIASGMAKALITTFYGSFISNILAAPVSQNLMIKSGKEVTLREMMVEGILAIQSGVNPRIVEDKLVSYLSPQERSEYMAANANSSEGVA